MHENQLLIDPIKLSMMITDQFPEFAGQRILALNATGTVNAILRIGQTHAARFSLLPSDPEKHRAALLTEAEASTEFTETCAFPSPRPYGVGHPTSDYPLPWAIQTWVDGEIASPVALSQSDKVSADLCALIASLRLAPLRGRTFDGRGRGGHLRAHDDWMETCFTMSENIFDVQRLRNIWAALRDLPSLGWEAMSHKDLIPSNLLVSSEHLTGVLDTGSYGAADPALDLVAAWHHLDHERRLSLKQTLSCSELEWDRGAAWALQQAIGLTWYYEKTNVQMSELGRCTINRLLEAYP